MELCFQVEEWHWEEEDKDLRIFFKIKKYLCMHVFTYMSTHLNLNISVAMYNFKSCGVGLSLRMEQVNSGLGGLFRGERNNRS